MNNNIKHMNSKIKNVLKNLNPKIIISFILRKRIEK